MQFRGAFWNVVWAIFILGMIYAIQPYHLFKVTGTSMMPTLEDGELVICNAGSFQVKSSGIYLINRNGEYTVKRVAFGPGDSMFIALGPDGNWTLTDDLNLIVYARRMGQLATYRIPDDKAYIVGDNADGSLDSRYYGLVSIEDFQAEVILR